MKGKTFFPFFLLFIFIVALTLGCLGNSGGLETTKQAQFTKGIFNTSIKINGQDKTETSLTSKQPAEVGLVLKNIGPNDVTNLTIRAIGCVDIEKSPDKISNFNKGNSEYISWSIRAPELGTSESFSCPLIFRACFEEESEGYAEIIVLNESFSDMPGDANYYYQSGIFSTEPNFGLFRVINDEKADTFPGKIKILNTGKGFVDYVGQKPEEKLEQNKIRQVTLSLDKDSLLEFYKIGELTPDTTYISLTGESTKKYFDTPYTGVYPHTDDTGVKWTCIHNGQQASDTGLFIFDCWSESQRQTVQSVFSDNNKKLTLTSGQLSYGTSEYEYLLRLIGQSELDVNMWFLAKENPPKAENYERLDYTINSGYCIDLATLNIKLSGK